MINKKMKKLWSGYGRLIKSKNEIDPDEIFLDSSNLPKFDNHQLEGRLVSPISKRNITLLSVFFILIFFIFRQIA